MKFPWLSGLLLALLGALSLTVIVVWSVMDMLGAAAIAPTP